MPSLVYYIDVGVKSPNYDAYGLFRALHSHWHLIYYFFQRKMSSYPSSVCRTEASKNVFIAWIM